MRLNGKKENEVRRHSDTVVVKVNSQHRKDARGKQYKIVVIIGRRIGKKKKTK